MELKLVRSVFNPKSTMGKLFVNGDFFAYSCEDTVRDLNGDIKKKIKSQTAIDPGKYEIVLTFSNRFKKYLPLLLNVKCFEAIRIHGGNTQDDSEGCILIGAQGDMKSKIWNCSGKVNGLVAAIKAVEKKEKSWIEVVDEK